MNLDGSDLYQLVQGGTGIGAQNPAWSPDGKYVAFEWETLGNRDIWVTTRAPSKFAVIIGVNEYSNPEDNTKGGPGNSATDMNKTLVEYMNFPSGHVHLLVDRIDVSDDDVTKAMVESELKWLQIVAVSEDIVVFYYAGHGYQQFNGSEYLYAHDLPIRDGKFAAEINKIDSEKLCVILDISFSGGFIKDGQTFWEGVYGLGGVWSDLAGETPSKRVVLTACAENVTIQYGKIKLDRDAAVWPYWPSGYRYECVFTHFLVQGFRGRADMNSDNKVTVEEAFRYARVRAIIFPIGRTDSKIHTGQTPMMYDGYPEYDCEGELYLGD